MRIIPTRIHGLLDYLVGLALIAAPWVFGFAPDMIEYWGYETWIPLIIGVALILMSIFTNYEWGIEKRINMPNHLLMDIVFGFVLAASPWAFNFAELVYQPHLIVGLVIIGLALISQRGPALHRPGFDGILHA
ncbi:MAG TPA: SPW repeat protein [Alphaproteobacteria bacterium]